MEGAGVAVVDDEAAAERAGDDATSDERDARADAAGEGARPSSVGASGSD